MSIFFIILEPLIYIGGIFALWYKRDLSILYLPAIIFARSVIVSTLPASVWYGFMFCYIFTLIYQNPFFYRKNIFAVALLLLHVILIPKSSDLVYIRPALFAVIWTLLLIPLAIEIVGKYNRITLFKELVNSANIILVVFLVNVLFSTIYGYSPHEMYGIKSGILYGELVDTDFNILGVIIFITLFAQTYRFNMWHLLLTLASIAAIGLSMRRSVIAACVLAILIILIILILRGRLQLVTSFLFGFTTITIIVVSFTDFSNVFKERFEQRNLAERELAGEARFAEYAILYKDAFVHYDLNPWLGYELLNSRGKYGKGIFGNRSLHADITNIIHSVGILGLMLYLLMVCRSFIIALKNVKTLTDSLIIVFCLALFIMFTITGRYTQTHYMLSLFLLLLLPLGGTSPTYSKHSKIQIAD